MEAEEVDSFRVTVVQESWELRLYKLSSSVKFQVSKGYKKKEQKDHSPRVEPSSVCYETRPNYFPFRGPRAGFWPFLSALEFIRWGILPDRTVSA